MSVWLVTGVSPRGLGRGIAEAAIANGDIVVGTVLDFAEIAEFDAIAPGRSLGRVLDVTDAGAIERMVSQIEREIGVIDVLVNNAGRGHEGAIEEADTIDLESQFAVNVLGPLNLAKAVLPSMRARRRGHIVNITSMGGLITVPGLGFYHASKFAMEGLSETLAKEVEGFGIRVTAVAPGSFRTGWAERSISKTERKIPDYETVFEPLRLERLKRKTGRTGDPRKAGEAVLRLVQDPNPPRHLMLGSDAVALVRAKVAALMREIDEWEKISVSTDDF